MGTITQKEFNMDITVRLKRAYGKDFYYPLSKMAIALCSLVNRKTLTKKQLDILERNDQIITIEKE